MRNKGVVIFFFVIILGLGILLEFLINGRVSEVVEQSKNDSLFQELKMKDSLIYELTKRQDSLLSLKNDSIIKIKKVYVSEINFIDSLDINGNVELLSRNLSQDYIIW